MTQRLRTQRWLAGAAVAAAALSPAAPTASASSAAASSPAGLTAAVRPLAPAAPHTSGSASRRAPKADPDDTADTGDSSDTAGTDPVADVPHEAYEELAGSAAGVGREHPGRPAAEPANPDTVLAARPLPVRPHHRPAGQKPVPPVPPVPPSPPSPPSAVTALGTGPNERAADLAAHILPLGTGFALMGLGLGYLGMRLRKGL
ncbi:hypothetical protein [Streptomyces sp. A1547]|uniref:Uncharacterized protein n=1 Tax=Streptomyces sp. R33 TaxID=3238629 RepID=A0AB39Y4X6_9ACTN|nr:hypothetical protein [Streptomyces sp. A1547]